MGRPIKPNRLVAQIDPTSLYTQLGYLLADIPSFKCESASSETQRWLARAYALVLSVGEVKDAEKLRGMSHELLLNFPFPPTREEAAAILYRALAVVELRVPAAVQGAFILAGNAFDALVALGKVLRTASKDALIVDPYMDEKILTDFGVLIASGVTIRLLAN